MNHDPIPASGVLGREPRAGVCLHLTSLPNAHGVGDLGDSAHGFVDAAAAMGLSVWQFLPTGPTAFGDSPYLPLSAFAGHELLIGLEPLLRQGLLRPDELHGLQALPRGWVDYPAVNAARQALLQRAVERFRANHSLQAGFEQFLHAGDNDWLHDYALFRILKERHGGAEWTRWAPRFVHRDRAALVEVAERNHEAMEAIKIAQYLFAQQWQALHGYARERGVRLFGDMPIYIALDSADAWAGGALLRLDAEGRPSEVAGVPPDYFSADGQLWGNPLYDWPRHADTGYDWWVRRVRAAVADCDLVRIDHFRGFESYWAVPAGALTAREGEWRSGPGDALFDALRGALGELPIVAEDLGLITEAVRDLRRRHGIPGMEVLQFAVDDPEFTPDRIEANCVCYTGTHDNDTTAGWFHGGPGDTRDPAQLAASRERALAFTGGAPDTIAHDLFRLALDSRALLAIAPMQDLLGLGSEARMNTPGVAVGNWRWRLQAESLSPEFLSSVRETVEGSARAAGIN